MKTEKLWAWQKSQLLITLKAMSAEQSEKFFRQVCGYLSISRHASPAVILNLILQDAFSNEEGIRLALASIGFTQLIDTITVPAIEDPTEEEIKEFDFEIKYNDLMHKGHYLEAAALVLERQGKKLEEIMTPEMMSEFERIMSPEERESLLRDKQELDGTYH